jgi:hypothetical protein
MVDYTLGEACQANGAVCCGNLHVGFELGGTESGIIDWAPREISEASCSAVPLRSKHQNLQTTEVVRGTNRPRIDRFVRRQSAPEVIARAWRFCGFRVAMLVQRVAEHGL